MQSPHPAGMTAGPRPRLRPSWAEQQRRRRKHPVRRLLDRSFGMRLLLAVCAAGLLLALVNRWEHCRHDGFGRGCLLADSGGVVNVSNVEALSIVSAAFLYLLESRQRRQRSHIQAMEVIQACQQSGARFSYARNEALELLSESGLWLDGLDLSGAQLQEIQAAHGRWRGMNLRGTNLQDACLQDADLQASDLSHADLRGADLRHADLRDVDLRDADLRHTNLSNADLRNTDLRGANLSGAKLDGANLSGSRRTEPENHPPAP
mgnify:CR=1 FL=1